jgi:hypothetical protein
MSTFALKQNVDVFTCHQGTLGSLLACFMGGGKNVTMVRIIMHKIVRSRCAVTSKRVVGLKK